MKVRFLGPLGHVTGSCTWLVDDENGWNFLVDCGLQQGEQSAEEWNNQVWPFDPKDLQFVVLTHAHLDHCGLIPRLYRDGFKGTVYCTAETAKLATLLLEDSARVGGVGYRPQDVAAIRWHEHRGPVFGAFHPVANNLFLRYFRTSHIVGAVSVAVVWGPPTGKQRTITFSGDIGPNSEDCEHLPFLRHRMLPPAGDFAVIESTYGNVIREPWEADPVARRSQLRALLDDAVVRNGVLVLPCFALGRTQDVLFDLHWLVAENPEVYSDVQFLLDAPLANRIHKVTLEGLRRTESNGRPGKVRPLWLGKQLFRWFELDETNPQHVERVLAICGMTLGGPAAEASTIDVLGNSVARNWQPLMRCVTDRPSLPQGRPVVLVTGGGMCDGGPIAQWLPALLGNPVVTVALTGYSGPSTVGGQLLNLRTTSPAELARHTGTLRWGKTQTFPIGQIAARIDRLAGYSAHADQSGLLDWQFWTFKGAVGATGRMVFCQHGDNRGREALAAALRTRASELGLTIGVQAPGDSEAWYDLEADGAAVSREAESTRLRLEIERLQAALERLAA